MTEILITVVGVMFWILFSIGTFLSMERMEKDMEL